MLRQPSYAPENPSRRYARAVIAKTQSTLAQRPTVAPAPVQSTTVPFVDGSGDTHTIGAYLSGVDTWFDQDTHSGLNFNYESGFIRPAGTVVEVAAGTAALTNNATRYIEVNNSGIVTASATRDPDKRPMYAVTTASGAITVVVDERAGFDFDEAGFTPLDIASLEVFLKRGIGVQTTTGVPATIGQTVQRWLDQSGNGYHATQATIGYRPTYQAGGLDYNGLNNWMSNSALVLPHPKTIIMRATIRDTGNGVLLDSDSPTAHALYLGDGGTNNEPLRFTADTVVNASAGTVTRNVPLIISLVIDSGGLASLWINGVNKFTAQNVGTNALNGFRLGDVRGAIVTGYEFDGVISDVLIFSDDLADADREDVEAYLS